MLHKLSTATAAGAAAGTSGSGTGENNSSVSISTGNNSPKDRKSKGVLCYPLNHFHSLDPLCRFFPFSLSHVRTFLEIEADDNMNFGRIFRHDLTNRPSVCQSKI